MIDETSEIIGWPIEKQDKELASPDAASTTTYKTLVDAYRTADMLMRQRNVAEGERDRWKIRAMKAEVERQALRAEVVDLREDRDSQKLRAETAERDRQTLLIKGTKFEQEWQALTTANTSLRDLLTLWEGQRDQAKQQAEAIGDNWQRTYDHDCKKLIAEADHWKAEWALVMGQLGGARAEVEAVRRVDDAMVERFLRAYAECEGERPLTFTHGMGVRKGLTAALSALAVQPTTGDKHE